jgi:hypothetical protein
MIQLIYDKDTAYKTNYIYLNLKNYLTSDFDQSLGFIVNLRSLFTNRDAFLLAVATYTDTYFNDRYVRLTIFLSPTQFLPLLATVQMATPERPMGLYDIEVYQNVGGIGSPSNIKIYSGLANVVGASGSESVTYTEYTANPSTYNNENVYLTID